MCDFYCALVSTICKLACHAKKRKRGVLHDINFPINTEQLREDGTESLTELLRAGGAIGENTSVTKMDLAPLGDENSALLSEIAVLTLEYEGTDADAAPKKMVAKFCPPDFETRITMDMFELQKSEVFFYNVLAPKLNIKMPKCYFADYCAKTGNVLILIELVEGDFPKLVSEDEFPLERGQAMMDVLVEIHAPYLKMGVPEGAPSDLKWVPRVDNKLFKQVGGLCKKDWGKYEELMKKYDDPIPEFVAKNKNLYMDTSYKIQQSWARSEWVTLTHGDCKRDNWYFQDDGSAGLLDWQLLSWSVSPAEMSYVFINLPIEFTKEHETTLLRRHFDGLQSQGAVSHLTFDEYMELYIISLLGCLVKGVLSCANLTDDNEKEVYVMNQRCIILMQKHNFHECFEKFQRGELKYQQSQKSARKPASRATTTTQPKKEEAKPQQHSVTRVSIL
eukprot:m.273434 g.273434  ORF g.273434 m.273434 type:complete len:448 (+) comp16280_c0_seq5:165-1508(+)